MKNKKRFRSPLCLVLAVALGSCVGVRADIVMKAGGSGVITLEYRLSKLAESLGKLDGNERWPTVPVGPGDFERTVARIDGLELRSFSTKQDGADMVTKVVVGFSDPQTLTRFLALSGGRASLKQENGKYRLALSLTSGSAGIDPDLLTLFTAVSDGYDFTLTLTAPGGGTLSLGDSAFSPLTKTPEMTLVPAGGTVSFSSPISGLFNLSSGASLTLTW